MPMPIALRRAPHLQHVTIDHIYSSTLKSIVRRCAQQAHGHVHVTQPPPRRLVVGPKLAKLAVLAVSSNIACIPIDDSLVRSTGSVRMTARAQFSNIPCAAPIAAHQPK